MFYRDALKSEDFSWERALSLAVASRLAYLRSEEGIIQMAKESGGFTDCVPIASADTQAFVAWDKECAVVSFRGSESIGDWLLNMKVVPEKRSYGQVHGGFFQGLEAIRPRLVDVLEQARVDSKKLWLTGHNLGGALATVMAAELVDRYAVTGIYSYGQPKTVDAKTAQFLRERYGGRFHRFVNDEDIVPGIPPGYRHVGRLIWFDPQEGVKAFDTVTEALETTDLPPELSETEFEQLQTELRELKIATEEGVAESRSGLEREVSDVEGLFPSFGDHPIARYITQIRRQIEQPAAVDEAISLAIAESRAEAAGIENVGPRSELRTLSRVPLLLRVRDPDWEAPAGIAVQSRLGNIVSAFAPPEQLEALRDDKEVESIESSREGGTPELADSKPFVRATDVHRPPIAEKGDSAIVAPGQRCAGAQGID